MSELISNMQNGIMDVYLNNTTNDFIAAASVFILTIIFIKGFELIIVRNVRIFASKTTFIFDDILADYLDSLHWPFYVFISLYTSLKYLYLNSFLDSALNKMLFLYVIYYSVRILSTIVDYVTKKEVRKRTSGEVKKSTSLVFILNKMAKVAFFSLAFLVILSNMGFNISSLLAGVGISGIAIAFALQKILEDVFSSFTIYFDKPFEEGDFIIIGTDMGIVEHIGIKSTRIRTLQGQELIVSNKELTSVRINNYKRMQRRRIVFSFGVEYKTSVKKLEQIKEIVKKIFKEIDLADLDRVHFKAFGDSSLLYEVVYYLNSPEYNDYMDTQEDINLKLKEKLEKLKVNFAYPTQTVYLKK